MGKYDSSQYRICPLMKEIGNDYKNIEKLLREVKLGGTSRFSGDLGNVQGKIRYKNGKENSEKKLRPPEHHLISIIELLCSDEVGEHRKLSEKNDCCGISTKILRGYLRGNDPNKRREMADIFINEIKKVYSDKEITQNDESDSIPNWPCFFEGNTSPDIFFETENYIIVVEGKWTEGKETNNTVHLKRRNQMVRHIQGAWEYIQHHGLNKKVIAFYIIPDSMIKDVPQNEAEFSAILEKETIRVESKQKIHNSYYGFITWEYIDKNIFKSCHFPSTEEIDFLINK